MSVPATRSRESRPAWPARRVSPFQELEDMQTEMNRLFDNVFGPTHVSDGGTSWAPPVDIEETDDAWIVEAELPGVDRKDITVELRDSELEISGDIKERERKGVIRRRTRRVGHYEYRVTLPGQPDAQQIEAKLRDGVLTVRVAKTERTQPRKIEVTT